jgi:HPt (histidine-containing phosphotransfer) domain-containing protein
LINTDAAVAGTGIRMTDESSRSNENTELINWTAALEATAGDQELLNELIVMFVQQEAPNMMTQIGQAVERGDAALLRRSAHTLKGSLRIFESVQASEYASQLEGLGKEGDLSEAHAVWEQLRKHMPRVLAALKERL